jgi:NTP pyrophosphatase (non-canonical NTP hydrolase)
VLKFHRKPLWLFCRLMMNNIFSIIQEMRIHFGWEKTDTKAFLVDAVVEEAHELKESLEISEAAFRSELADVLMYALTLCMDENIDVESLIKEKALEVMSREY